MLGTLRRRSILSHALPLAIIAPVVGLVLIYLVESQVLLDSISKDLTAQAALVSDIAADPVLWQDAAQSRQFADRMSARVSAEVRLLTITGLLVASSEPEDAASIGAQMSPAGMERVMARQVSVRMTYSQNPGAEVADVLAPVYGQDQAVVGAVRLTHRLDSVSDQFQRLRALVVAVVVAGLALSILLGWALANTLERPLRGVTRAALALSEGQPMPLLPETGPREVGLLAHAFNTLSERLRASEENRRQLLANVVHELGRPLGALRSATQALAGGAADDVALRGELLSGMDDQLRRLQRLLDDLILYYGQGSGAVRLDRRLIPLGEWLPALLAPWREQAQAKGLQWQAELPPSLPAVSADADRLAQALENLLSNAIKYTPAGGGVAVDTGRSEGLAWIRVADTGPGMAPEVQARIFDPFYRGQTGQRFPQGMGLGLTIARGIISAHGGRLDVDSAPGQGSRFTLYLPCP
jgi:signal transduction histidine kinase